MKAAAPTLEYIIGILLLLVLLLHCYFHIEQDTNINIIIENQTTFSTVHEPKLHLQLGAVIVSGEGVGWGGWKHCPYEDAT